MDQNIYIYFGSWSLSGIILYSKQCLYHEVIFGFITGTSTSIYGDDGFCCFIFMLENKTWLVYVRVCRCIFLSWCESYSAVWVNRSQVERSISGNKLYCHSTCLLGRVIHFFFWYLGIIVSQMCCLLYNQISLRKRLWLSHI